MRRLVYGAAFSHPLLETIHTVLWSQLTMGAYIRSFPEVFRSFIGLCKTPAYGNQKLKL